MIAAEAGAVVVLAAAPALLRALAPLLPAGTLFGELVYDGTAPSASRCRATLAACRALGLPFVATNAVRFAAPEGFATHRVLRAIGENGTVWSTQPRARAAHFLKSPAEMAALFAHLPEALEATARIAEECACPIGFEGWRFPAAHLPAGETPFSRPLAEELRGAAAALSPALARGGGAAALRALDHRGEGLLPVLPRRRRDRRQGARVGPADDRARLGGQQPRLALPRADARGPARPRALLRALSQPRALVAAGHRPGLLVEGPRPAAGVGLRALRRTSASR